MLGKYNYYDPMLMEFVCMGHILFLYSSFNNRFALKGFRDSRFLRSLHFTTKIDQHSNSGESMSNHNDRLSRPN